MPASTNFSKQLKAFSKEAEKEATRRYRRVAMKALEIVCQRTPTRTGAMRANWNVSSNEPNYAFNAEKTDQSNGGAQTYARESLKIADLTLKNQCYISNGATYAEKIENGWSNQAPNGIVGATKQDIENLIKKGAL